jgi:hypothetical protein
VGIGFGGLATLIGVAQDKEILIVCAIGGGAVSVVACATIAIVNVPKNKNRNS